MYRYIHIFLDFIYMNTYTYTILYLSNIREMKWV